jgi:hypothetical protein
MLIWNIPDLTPDSDDEDDKDDTEEPYMGEDHLEEGDRLFTTTIPCRQNLYVPH